MEIKWMLIAFKQAQLNKISPQFDQRQFKLNGFILQINFLLHDLLHGWGGGIIYFRTRIYQF
jgi:hypothetical protein